MTLSAPNNPRKTSIIVIIDDPVWRGEVIALVGQVRSLKPVVFECSLPEFLESDGADIAGGTESKLTTYARAIAADVCLFALEAESETENMGNLEWLLRELDQPGLSLPVITLARWRGIDNGVGALQRGAADYLIRAAMRPTMIERSLRFALERDKQRRIAEGIRKDSVAVDAIVGDSVVPSLFEMRTIFEQLLHKLGKVKDAKGCADLAKQGIEILNEILPPSPRDAVIDYEEHSLNQMVQDAVELLQRMLRGSFLIEYDLPDEDILVPIDPTELQEAIIELALNAQEAMLLHGNDSSDARLEICLSKAIKNESVGRAGKKRSTGKQMVCLEIRESLVDVNPEVVKSGRTPATLSRKTVKDFGVGLSTVKRSIERIGGSIEILNHQQPAAQPANETTSSEKTGNDNGISSHRLATAVKLWFPLRGAATIEAKAQQGVVDPALARQPRVLFLFSDDNELADLISAYAFAAAAQLIPIHSVDQLKWLFDPAEMESSTRQANGGCFNAQPGLLVVDTNKINQRLVEKLQEIVCKTGVSLVLVGESLSASARLLCENSSIPYYRRPDELVLLATRLRE